MASKYEKEAERESDNQQLLRDWIRQRIGKIHERVTVFDVFRKNGVDFDHEDRATQFSCPFHGQDKDPSARAYPESAGSPSHAWCFVCQERWDAISVFRKYSGPEKKFTRTLTEMEQAFGVDRTEFPEGIGAVTEDVEVEEDFEAFRKLEAACESRLIRARKIYDLQGFTKAASLLERVSFRVLDRRMSKQAGEQRLRTLLDNIGKRMQACPDS